MNPIRLLFLLVEKFLDIPGHEKAKAQSEGNEWYDNIRYDKDVEKKGIEYHFKRISEKWYMKLVYGFLFLWLSRKIADWMNPSIEDEIIEDEDLDTNE